MSQENVEMVRRMLGAWNDRDLESALSLSAPEVEYVNAPTAVEPGTRHGHDGIATVFRAQWEFLSDARLEVERIFDRGDEVLAHVRMLRPMPGSDQSVEGEGLALWTFRDGQVSRIRVLATGPTEIPEALEAAGLSD